jgi:hypothetical protein
MDVECIGRLLARLVVMEEVGSYAFLIMDMVQHVSGALGLSISKVAS